LDELIELLLRLLPELHEAPVRKLEAIAPLGLELELELVPVLRTDRRAGRGVEVQGGGAVLEAEDERALAVQLAQPQPHLVRTDRLGLHVDLLLEARDERGDERLELLRQVVPVRLERLVRDLEAAGSLERELQALRRGHTGFARYVD